jgi:amino acid adenylation domain-containing protein
VGEQGGRRLQTVHVRLRASARADPGAIAVVDDAGSLTLGALDARANGLAHRLRAMGVGPGVLVALCHERSAAAVVGALAVWKAGGAFVALDPSHPDARLVALVRDARARLLLANESIGARLAGAGATLVDLDAVTDDERADAPTDIIDGDDVAYVVYTSGSTGAPKGVEVTHANLANLIDWHCGAFEVGPHDRASVLASPAFDASVWETWPALVAGARLHIANAATVAAPDRLREWLIEQRITIAFVPTPLAEILLARPWPPEGALRTMLTGGDRLHRRPRSSTPFRLVNNYGVTEATVVSTSGVVAPSDADGRGRLPTIGHPIAGTRTYVVDTDGLPVHAGEVGELWIGGAGVARGYLGRPQLTAERFGRDPFDREPGARVYRTGDLVRVAAGGEYEFLGRRDDQVQIRGQRVELAEVAAALSEHRSVGHAVVVARARADDVELVGYVVPAPETTIDRAELREHLASRLPPAMVPCTFVAIERLPLTSNGKVDRAALPEIDLTWHSEPADRTPVEYAVGAILEELLAVPGIGRDDNFFELGGHSLMAAQLVARLEEWFDIEVELLSVFDNPTAAGIAAVIERDVSALHAASE